MSTAIEGICDDVFDEIEQISKYDREIRNLSTDAVLASYRHLLSYRAVSKQKTTSINEDEQMIGTGEDSTTAMKDSKNFTSLYQILPDSFKERFNAGNAAANKILLEKLKRVSTIKSGMNKRAHEIETYVWKSAGSNTTFEEGGRLGSLRDDRSGRQSNWHHPFFGQYVQIESAVKRDVRRVACLLCKNLETMHNVRNTLLRHMSSHHSDYSAVFAVKTSSAPGDLDPLADKSSDATWQVVLKQIQLCFVEFIPFKVVSSESFAVYVKALNPKFTPYDAKKLCHTLLYNLYAPSLHHLSQSLNKQLLCLPKSFCLVLDCWTKPGVGSVYGCSVVFIDSNFVVHSFVLGLTPLSDKVEVVPYAVAKIIASIGPLSAADCYALVSHDTAESRAIASALGLHIVGLSVDDVLRMLLTVNSAALSPQEADGSSEKLLDVPTAIARAQALVDYFLSSDIALTTLFMCGDNKENVRLQHFNSADPSTLPSFLSSILRQHRSINVYFTKLRADLGADFDFHQASRVAPTRDDWTFWSQLIAVVDPARTVVEMLKGKNDPGISLLWYVLDWLVCIHEQTTEWDVYSLDSGNKHYVPLSDMCPGIKQWILNFTSLIQDNFLSMKLKTTNYIKYCTMCRATFLDPRTKNFKFFRSEAFQSVAGGARAGFPSAYKNDAKAFVFVDMKEELSALVQDLFLGNLHPEDKVYGLVYNIVSSAGIVVNVSTAPYPGPQRHTRSAFFGKAVKRSLDESQGAGEQGGQESKGDESTPPTTESSSSFLTASLNAKIDTYCRYEMEVYEDEEMICLPHQIRQHDALAYWAQNAYKFPILSQLARRVLCLRNVSVTNRINSAASRLHRRERNFVSLALVDAVTFLHLNGVIESYAPDESIVPPSSS